MNGRGSLDWIQVGECRGTSEKFFPLAARPDEVDIRDIARALSNQCRYAGHVLRYYSTAEHSVRVSRIVYERTSDPEKALWGLLHDASEAYLYDVTRPMKRQTEFAAYRTVEARLQAVICKRFDLDVDQPAEVSRADSDILGTEAFYLKSPIHPDWAKTTPTGELPPPDHRVGMPLGWSPLEAERMFIARFDHLCLLTRREREIYR